jgi:replicative DNA helicase
MIEKIPPHDSNAEKAVLGAVLIDPAAVSMAAQIVKPEYFYIPEHEMVFSAILGLFEKRQPVDLVTLTAELKKTNSLKKVGGSAFLSELINTVPTSAYVENYAEIVKGHYIKRKLISFSSRLVERSFEDKEEVKKLLDSAESEIFGLSESYIHRDFVHLKDILAQSFERLEEFSKNQDGLRGVPTGFKDLDNRLAGLQDSNLLILAARPGIGKTTLALNIAMHAALKEKMPVGIFSLEMSKEELVDRLLVGQADIDAWKLKTGKLSSDDYSRLTQAMGELSEAPMYIDDTPGLSILEMRTKARKLKIEKGIKLIIVDYLQLLDSGKRIDNRVQEVSYISQNLKNIARELKVPVMALSQLSRAIENRTEKRPQLSDLRESGSIEQDADVVMFLYFENDGDDLLDKSKRICKLSIAKHRNGPTAELSLMFRGDRVRFFGVENKL